jgi:hypothetical protein
MLRFALSKQDGDRLQRALPQAFMLTPTAGLSADRW